jgi:hypothetical protein
VVGILGVDESLTTALLYGPRMLESVSYLAILVHHSRFKALLLSLLCRLRRWANPGSPLASTLLLHLVHHQLILPILLLLVVQPLSLGQLLHVRSLLRCKTLPGSPLRLLNTPLLGFGRGRFSSEEATNVGHGGG